MLVGRYTKGVYQFIVFLVVKVHRGESHHGPGAVDTRVHHTWLPHVFYDNCSKCQ